MIPEAHSLDRAFQLLVHNTAVCCVKQNGRLTHTRIVRTAEEAREFFTGDKDVFTPKKA